ncbi:MAG: efflux RND transporter permease subunit, partial [Hymenobacteraceae bacterium]|nr:efflux RND transporter permease subunit [Hymenobacteraceae bacterium]MDX5395440.1 efflux RND transporter permease subunit [Hymenobacteraceae bacterium]MDX5511489.1 efflux RND transporter permease subunit [Hymenobacteraceae bacterium]
SEIRIWGEREYAMRLWMDPLKMSAFNVTPTDVAAAVQRENLELPSGKIEGDQTELTVRTMGRLFTPEEFNDLIIREEGDKLVRFRDIGHAELGSVNERTLLRRDGVPMVGVVIIPQPGSNHIDIVDEFYRRVEMIEKDMPKDLELMMGFDNTEYIRASIKEVKETIFIALALVVGIIFLFLRDVRSTIIPILAIPVSLIGIFFVMYIAGFSINVLTLLAMVLAIGLVVDDAIVMLENIYAKIEDGVKPVQAAFKGAREIFFAIIATTVALAAVFLPVIFLEGITGRLFREFGIVVAGAVIISSFVSLTLTPMMSSRLLKYKEKKNWFYRKTEPFFESLTNAYRSTLESFMAVRWVAFVIMLVAAGAIYIFMKTLPSELAPLEDRSSMRVMATGPEGASYEYMEKYVGKMLRMVNDSVPESEALISVTSPGFGTASLNSAFLTITLVDPEDRSRSQMEIADELSADLKELPAARAYVTQQQSIGGGRRGGLPVEFVVQSQNMDKLKEVIPQFMAEAQQHPTFQFVDLNLKFTKPELRVEIDREK